MDIHMDMHKSEHTLKLKMNEYQTNNHQHNQIEHIQLDNIAYH